MPGASRSSLIVAFAAVYLLWGSTYLAIRYAVEGIPPFLMAGTRFLVAGLLLLGYSLWKRRAWPKAVHWRNTAIVGVLLLVGGNGAVSWAEQRTPSGVAALLVASVPFWMVLLNWIWGDRERPSWRTGVGLFAGFAGLVVLVAPWTWGHQPDLDPLGLCLLLFASFSWAAGSIFSRGADMPASPLVSTGLEMTIAGLVLYTLGALAGEVSRLQWPVPPAAAASVVYLIVAGSLGGFSAYVYLLQHTTPDRASTYAFVNPVVAVLLGWLVAHEPLSARMLTGAGLIVLGVIVILFKSARRVSEAPPSGAIRKTTN